MIKKITNAIFETADEFNLKINAKKSAFMKLGDHKDLKGIEHNAEMKQIPLVKEYQYLGVLINNRGNLNGHVEKIKGRAKYLIKTLYNINNNL